MSWRDFAGLRAHYAAGASPMMVVEELLQRIAAFADPANAGKGALKVGGKMTELLHRDMAERLLAKAAAIAAR